ncbi:MAG: hypothetical protein SVG88_05230 [Halobacteriales archaeon]|nr:hypothetical protein [Halobacteriales archaeon]
MAVQPLEVLYILASVALVLTGLIMVGLGVRAYFRTERRSMMLLSIGFSTIVAAAAATSFSAFVSGFENALFLLTVHFTITTIGYVVVIYSVTVATH